MRLIFYLLFIFILLPSNYLFAQNSKVSLHGSFYLSNFEYLMQTGKQNSLSISYEIKLYEYQPQIHPLSWDTSWILSSRVTATPFIDQSGSDLFGSLGLIVGRNMDFTGISLLLFPIYYYNLFPFGAVSELKNTNGYWSWPMGTGFEISFPVIKNIINFSGKLVFPILLIDSQIIPSFIDTEFGIDFLF